MDVTVRLYFSEWFEMNDPYHRSYSALGIRPGSGWNEIRNAYRILVKKWHPDRFQQDSKNREIAEEKTREITRAYKTLADYYREHGSAPANPPSPATPSAGPLETTMPFEHTGRTTTTDNTAASVTQTDVPAQIPAEAAWWKTLFTLPILALLLYLWLLNEPADHNHNIGALPKGAVQAENQPAVGDNIAPHPADRFFTLGTKLGEVYAIQGIPSKTEQGVWHYGKSRVYFVNGSVSHWDSHPANPLRARIDVDPVISEKYYFGPGSTKDEVRALQGTPWSQTEREWTYGSSRVFFNGETVTGWEESPLNPLKIRK